MSGTADNYLRGKLLINTTTVSTFALDVNGTARVSGNLTGGNNFILPYAAGSITSNALTWGNTIGLYLDNSFFFLGDSFNSGICLNNTNSITNPIFFAKLNQNTYVKNSNSASSYTLKIVNDFNDSANTFSGILFAAGTGVSTAARGKGGLVYNQNGNGWNRGDFYFLQNSVADGTIASISDVVLAVKNNGSVKFVPRATPSSAEAGDVYYDSSTNKLRCYNGTSWNDLF
jgi:hypothetical protein